MKLRVLGTALVLLLSGVTMATPASAQAPTVAATAAKACAGTFSFPLNLAAAAKVDVANGAQPAHPAGMAAAQALADEAMAQARVNPCEAPVSDAAQSAIDSAKDSLDSGDRPGARAVLVDFLNGLEYVSRTRMRSARAGSTCEGFANHDLQLPDEARSAIAVAQEAQLIGADDIAGQAMAKAVAITSDWAKSGAGNEATSVSEWLGIAAKLQLLGADDTVTNAAISHMHQAAKAAYDNYNTSACRATAAGITCFLKAAQFLAMTDSAPASMSADVAYQLKAARSLKQGKGTKCPIEKYVLRLSVHSQGGDGVSGGFDTGQVSFTVRNGRITGDPGTLKLDSGRSTCWYQDGETWKRAAAGTVTGGSFPFTVAGTDDGDVLHLRLVQKARWSVAIGGGETCRAFAALGQEFLSTFTGILASPGFELPPGAHDIDITDTTYGVFEPTGETTVDTYHEVLRMTYPKRT